MAWWREWVGIRPLMWPQAIVGLLLMVAAIGCGLGVRYVYEKPGVSDEQRQRDESECREPATVTVAGSYGSSRQTFDQSRFNRCMADRGYAVRPIETGPPPSAPPLPARY